jgi:hypothetical protein
MVNDTAFTISGVKGQAKKALNQLEGAFRATSEDKLLMSGKWTPTWIGFTLNSVIIF